VRRSTFVVRLDYADEQNARRVLTRLGIEIVSADYTREAALVLRASDEEKARAVEEISEITRGRARLGSDEDAI
jgi:putative IMPACT (imprinted ancient) family translation regulator